MPAKRDLTGLTFGRLTVIKFSHHSQCKRRQFLCRCECGKTTTVDITHLTRGNIVSCGCFLMEKLSGNDFNRQHGSSRKGNKNYSAYVSWSQMKQRCLNPSSKDYPHWGGRGIKVTERWLGKDGFKNFLADMGPRPTGTTLDRKNVNGNYSKKNCRWGTDEEQQNNRRSRYRTHEECQECGQKTSAKEIYTCQDCSSAIWGG